MPVAVGFSTIPEMFRNVTDRFAKETRPVLMYKEQGEYKGISYTELRSMVEWFACGLAALGIKRGDRVAIIGENRPEWVVSDQAIVALGAIDVPLYPTLTAKETEFIFNDSGVRVAIVSNQFQLNKVMRVFGNVRTLEKVILMSDKSPIAEPNTLGFRTVMEMGKSFNAQN